ncbi:MAG: hypothetical protein PHD02_03345 [Bacilli bacterium]|nr:hypothetical protein [Bacilli bacterium]
MAKILDRNEIAHKIKITCSNYDYIVDSPLNDPITNAIRDDYTEFVVNNITNNKDIELVKRYDTILGEYVNNPKFFKEVKRRLSQYFDEDCEYECVIVNLFEELDFIYKNFMNEKNNLRKVTRWI